MIARSTGHTYQSSRSLFGAMQYCKQPCWFAWGPSRPNLIKRVSVGYQIRTRHIAYARLWLCGLCALLHRPYVHKNKGVLREGWKSMSVMILFLIFVTKEPLTSNLFSARFADCHFYETIFPSLGGDKNVNVPKERRELSWTSPLCLISIPI